MAKRCLMLKLKEIRPGLQPEPGPGIVVIFAIPALAHVYYLKTEKAKFHRAACLCGKHWKWRWNGRRFHTMCNKIKQHLIDENYHAPTTTPRKNSKVVKLFPNNSDHSALSVHSV